MTHKEFLREVSGYFRAALTGQFAEAKDDEITLLEQDADVFEEFLVWMYTKSIDTTDFEIPDEATLRHLGAVSLNWGKIRELYIFAKYIQCQTLANELLKAVCKILFGVRVVHFPEPEIIASIYQATPEDCGLRRLVMALFLWKRQNDSWRDLKKSKEWISKFPAEFCHELLVRTSRQVIGIGEQNPFGGASTDECPFID